MDVIGRRAPGPKTNLPSTLQVRNRHRAGSRFRLSVREKQAIQASISTNPRISTDGILLAIPAVRPVSFNELKQLSRKCLAARYFLHWLPA
jgi:hypothetical protein